MLGSREGCIVAMSCTAWLPRCHTRLPYKPFVPHQTYGCLFKGAVHHSVPDDDMVQHGVQLTLQKKDLSSWGHWHYCHQVRKIKTSHSAQSQIPLVRLH